MFSALKNLLSSSQVVGERGISTPRGSVRQHKTAVPGPAQIDISSAEIDSAFYGLVLGVQSPIDCYLNDFEKRALRELDRLLTSNAALSSLVPRLPAIIPKVMGTLRHPSSSSAELASQLGRDPVLVSEVIRLANSSCYRAGKKITSLERAVFVLGHVGVRQLVTNAAFRPLINLNCGHFTRLSGTTLWDQSEKTAIACDCMAKWELTDRFNAYLMGIVANVGFTVSLHVLDRNFDGSQAPHSQLFHDKWISRSRALSCVIAREWGFPANVLEALESQVDSKDLQSSGTTLYVSDKISKMHILAGRGRLASEIAPLARRLYGGLTAYCTQCCETLSA